MSQIIDCHRQHSTVGFANSISSAFWQPRLMSAGVSVDFREHFGRPTPSRCLTNNLPLQKNKDEAALYSLVTKINYFGKAELKNYN